MTTAKSYPPLDQEVRAGLPTDAAAYHLGRRPQTLRTWACTESGPIRPRRIAGLLLWPTAEIRILCGVASGPAPQTLPMRQPEPASPPELPKRGRGRPPKSLAVVPA